MTDYESGHEQGPASQQELGALFNKATSWLENNTNIFVEPSDEITGSIEGVPIASLGPLYQFEIPAKAIHKVLPESVEFFGSEDSVFLIYSMSHFTSVGEDQDALQYHEGVLFFDVEKQSEPKYEVFITISNDDDADDTWRLGKAVDADRESKVDLKNYEGTLPFIDEEYFNDRITANIKLPRHEFNIITAIVDKLDEIKALLAPEDPPLFLPNE